MLASVASIALVGVEAEPVQVEVNANEEGEPRLVLVGLPDSAVKESADRVFSALSHCGFRPLRTRTTINLAPGDLRKEGPLYDLPIALGLLVATGQLDPGPLADFVVAGELGLSGATRAVRGGLAIARAAKKAGMKGLLLPGESAEEAALAGGLAVYRIDSLPAAVSFLTGQAPLEAVRAAPLGSGAGSPEAPDFSDLKGQPALRRAIEVAVAGAHAVLVIGPPGTGKSMAAKRIPGIMPAPSRDEQLEILGIHSIARRALAGRRGSLVPRPFRAPHHTITDAALLGGGVVPGPGEVSLAHHGVLFLDELPEFRRSVLEVLRQPLEDFEITISRCAAKTTFPCAFMLVAAMNPCPCGHLGDPRRRCRCTPAQIERYRAKISGPLLDRIDLHIEAPALSVAELRSTAPCESSAAIRARVEAARHRQRERFGGSGISVNARMSHVQIRRHCPMDSALGDILQEAMERLSLSARGYDRILKVARTIADLADCAELAAPHLLEAIQYRSLDRGLPPAT